MGVQREGAVPRTVPRRSARTGRALRLARYGTQTAVGAVVVWQVVAAVRGQGRGAEGLCPFGGFETLWTWITTGRTVHHVHPANLVLAAGVLVMALLARGSFCGWMCPFGALQGAINALTRGLVDHVPGGARTRRRIEGWAARPDGWVHQVDRLARHGRWLVLTWALVGAAVTGTMVFREADPWAALISIADFEVSLAFVVLLAVGALSTVVRRPFCRYACPLGAVQGIVAKASPVAVQRDAAACLGCDLCNRACPMGIPVNTRTRVTDASCLGCLECVAACPSREALGVSVALPLPAATRQEVEV